MQYPIWVTCANREIVYGRVNHQGQISQWPLKSWKEHLREGSRNCSTAAAACIVLNGRGIRSRTVASEASPTTVWLQWFSILRALPSESNTTMREKLGSRRLQNWLPPSREKSPGVGTADFKSVMRGAFRSLSGRCSCWGVPSTGTRPCGENFKS